LTKSSNPKALDFDAFGNSSYEPSSKWFGLLLDSIATTSLLALGNQSCGDEENNSLEIDEVEEDATGNEQLPQHKDRAQADVRVQLQPSVDGVPIERLMEIFLCIFSSMKVITFLTTDLTMDFPSF
jgi:hypothetical protein